MTDPKAAAADLVTQFESDTELVGLDAIHELLDQAHIVARAYLSLTADKGAEERAREIASEWLSDFNPPPQITFTQSEFLQHRIAAALAAEGARVREEATEAERDRCLSICNTARAYCALGHEEVVENIERAIRGGSHD